MVTVLLSLSFALPTSVLLCLTRGLDWLQGSGLVLAVLVSIPAVVTSAMLLLQALRRPFPFGWRAAAKPAAAADRGFAQSFDQVEG